MVGPYSPGAGGPTARALQTNHGRPIGGVAGGTGTATWSPHGAMYESTGMHVKGKKEGHWGFRFPVGDLEQGLYVNGKRHGEWA